MHRRSTGRIVVSCNEEVRTCNESNLKTYKLLKRIIMKKENLETYVSPAVTVIELEIEQAILSSSGDMSGEDVYWQD